MMISDAGDDFVLSYPVYIVADRKPTEFEPMLAQNPTDRRLGLALFTEELLAERCRDNWKRSAGILGFQTVSDLISLLKQVLVHLSNLEVKYVAVDPRSETDKGRAAWISIDEIIRKGSGGGDSAG